MISARSDKRLPLLWLLGAFVLAASSFAPMWPGPGSAADVDTDYVDTYYIVGHPFFLIGLPAVFCLFGAIYLALAATPLFRVRPVLGYAHFAVMLIGAALVQAPMVMLRAGSLPKRYEDPVASLAAWSQLSAIGYVLLNVGLLVFLGVLIDGWRRRSTGTS
jgi:cytochrome c oxidase subunit 1